MRGETSHHRIRNEVTWQLQSARRLACRLGLGPAVDRAERGDPRPLAHCQKALSWELPAGISLARLRVARNRHGEAKQILAPIYEQFH
jgi:hypothetical protein